MSGLLFCFGFVLKFFFFFLFYFLKMPCDAKVLASVADASVSFISQAITGIFRALYRMQPLDKHFSSLFTALDKKKDPVPLRTEYLSMEMKYMNDCYRRAVLRDDPALLKLLDPITEPLAHSIQCILLILGPLVFNAFDQIEWTSPDLGLSSLERWTAFIEKQLHPYFLKIKLIISQGLNHSCHGPKRHQLNPHEPLFKAKVMRADGKVETLDKESCFFDPEEPEDMSEEDLSKLDVDGMIELLKEMLDKKGEQQASELAQLTPQETAKQKKIREKRRQNKKKKKEKEAEKKKKEVEQQRQESA